MDNSDPLKEPLLPDHESGQKGGESGDDYNDSTCATKKNDDSSLPVNSSTTLAEEEEEGDPDMTRNADHHGNHHGESNHSLVEPNDDFSPIIIPIEMDTMHFPALVVETGSTFNLKQVMRAVFLPEPTMENSNDEIADTTDALLVRDESVRQPGGIEDGKSCLDPFLDCLIQLFNCCCHDDSTHAFIKASIDMVLSILLLQISFSVWGYEMERIMTTPFEPTARVPGGRFPSASFCVFCNRLTALMVATAVVTCRHGVKRGLLFQNENGTMAVSWRAFAPVAISNTLSSWFQYLSLKFVDSPVLIVFKSFKIIPVMLLGKLMHGTRYSYGEYVEGILIVVGVIIFSLAHSASHHHFRGSSINVQGFFYLLVYLLADAFTSQWQSTIYNTYGRRNVDAFQMMLAVSMLNIIFTTIAMAGDIPAVLDFLYVNPTAMYSLLLAAVASTLGQVVIFHIIREHGPLIFAIVVSVRQGLFSCLSAVVFSHDIPPMAIVGALVMFGTLGYQIRKNYSLARQPDALVDS